MYRKRIGEILVDLGVLTLQEVEQILDVMDCRDDCQKFGKIAREMRLVTEEQILAALAVQMQMFPNIDAMSLEQILKRLRDPILTPPQMNLKRLRSFLPPRKISK